MKYKCVFKRLQSLAESKQGVRFFAVVSCCTPPNSDINFIKTIAKFLSDNADVLQTLYNSGGEPAARVNI